MIIQFFAKRYFNLIDGVIIGLMSIMIYTKAFSLPIFVFCIFLLGISILFESIASIQDAIKSIDDF